MKVFLVYLVLFVGFASSDVLACACSPAEVKAHEENDTEVQFANAEVVFVGRPIKIEVMSAEPQSLTKWQMFKDAVSSMFGNEPAEPILSFPAFLDSVQITFEVSEYLKGSGPEQIQIMTGYGGTDCGLSVSILYEYSIFARRLDEELRTSYCFGSAEYESRPSQQSCPSGS